MINNSFLNQSSIRILFLLKLLLKNEYNKIQIIDEYKKYNYEIKKTTINNYIKKLRKYNIEITEKIINNKKYYSEKK